MSEKYDDIMLLLRIGDITPLLSSLIVVGVTLLVYLVYTVSRHSTSPNIII
jgi:hypothetical protein